MRLIQNISVLLLTGVFLLSATGLFLRFHDCDTCEVSEIFINTDKHEHAEEAHSSCCSDFSCKVEIQDETTCCANDIYYLKISEPYVFSFINIDFKSTYNIVFDFFNINTVEKFQLNLFSNKTIKPPNIYGLKLLLNICILRL